MSLQTSYRPTSFKNLVGNEDIKYGLIPILKRKVPPAAFLFIGPGGTGKTTIARIIKRALKCDDIDWRELNAADDRGIDETRELIKSMKFKPLVTGGNKVYLLDEAHCFHSDTLISTLKGQKRIDSVKVGDVVFNLNETDIVEKVFINKVSLNNVARINKADGSYTFCSKDHEYYIDGEWVEAKDLTNIPLVKYSQHMTYTSLQGSIENEMRMVRKTNNKKQILFQKLFSKVCQKLCKEYCNIRRTKRENKKICFSTQTDRAGKTNGIEFFRTYEEKESNAYSRCERKNVRDSKNKWNSSRLEWESWWKRTINRTAEIINDCISMGTGSCCEDGRSFAYETTGNMVSQKENSYLLQSRFRKSEIEDCNRDRWKESQFNSEKETGQKERIFSEMERVESVEIYKSGSNDESFSSVIGHKERSQGFVEFYDLQIKKNHSYIANNNMVHNCLTKPAQEALLKSLEEPPEYVHWVLCTTNPETLKPTLKRRCHIYELELLKSKDIQRLFRMVLKKEGRECVSMDVRDHIIELANGSAGVALKLLDQVIDMDDTARAISALKNIGTSDAEVLEICRALTHYNMPPKTKWVKVKKLIKDLKGDGEAARRPILGYLNAIMLNNGGDDIFFIMKPFANNFFDSGKAGLTMACYAAIFNIDEGE